MQKKTIELNRRLAENTRSGKINVTLAKETIGGVIAMSTCRICGKPAIYTLQSIFVCVPCRYIRYTTTKGKEKK